LKIVALQVEGKNLPVQAMQAAGRTTGVTRIDLAPPLFQAGAALRGRGVTVGDVIDCAACRCKAGKMRMAV